MPTLDSTFTGRIGAAASVRTLRARPRVQGDDDWITPGRAHTDRRADAGHRSRQRAAAFGRWRHRRRHRSPPHLGAVVFRHDPDRRLRRGSDGRRRFCVARRRNQFRHRAGARSRARCAAPSARSATSSPTARATACRRPAKPAPRARCCAISTTTKVGDREVVRARPYRARVRQPDADEHGIRRQRAAVQSRRSFWRMAGADGVPADDQPGAEPDAEVSYVTRDLAGILPTVKIASALPIDDIIARVRDTANWTGGSQNRYQVASLPPGGGAPLAYAADGTPDPYAGFETRIVPENITLLPKTGAQVTGGNGWNERSVTVKKGDNIAHDPQGDRRDAGRDRGDRGGARPARPRQRPEGRPEAAHPGRATPAGARAAADPRDRDGRQRDRGRRRALRHGQIRLGRRRQHEHAGRRRRATTTTTTTARACGSTRASTRRRCATTSRSR